MESVDQVVVALHFLHIILVSWLTACGCKPKIFPVNSWSSCQFHDYTTLRGDPTETPLRQRKGPMKQNLSKGPLWPLCTNSPLQWALFISLLASRCFSIWTEAKGSVDAVASCIRNAQCSMPKQKSCHWGSQNLMSEAQEGPPQNQSSIIVLFCTCHVCVLLVNEQKVLRKARFSQTTKSLWKWLRLN